MFGIWIVFSFIYSSIKNGFKSDEDDYEYVDYYEDDSQDFDEDSDYERPRPESESFDEIRDEILVGDYYVHEHTWKDNKQNEYEGTFKVKESYMNVCTAYRDGLRGSSTYPQVYKKLSNFDKNKLDELIDMYDEIKHDKKLNQKQFADMVVTSIQNIPYVLVHDYSHEEADEKWGGFIEEYHKSGDVCLEKIKFGLQSPVEFMCNFLGDCDTRVLLCYLVLKEFGFDVAMLGSTTYGHEVLGISGNYRGSYVKKDGIKYYAWETTATGYRPGVLSPDFSNMDYWFVDITSRD